MNFDENVQVRIFTINHIHFTQNLMTIKQLSFNDSKSSKCNNWAMRQKKGTQILKNVGNCILINSKQ